jgi:DNA-binding CsgD family transcriptional regulator
LLQKAGGLKAIGAGHRSSCSSSAYLSGKKRAGPGPGSAEYISLARPERYIRTFVDEGEPMVRLLHLARARQIETEYVTDLLSVIEKATGKTQPPSQLLIKPLTMREIEVLLLIEAGYSNQDIAGNLVISIPTVKRHISNIYAKLGVESRTQALAIGKELKIRLLPHLDTFGRLVVKWFTAGFFVLCLSKNKGRRLFSLPKIQPRLQPSVDALASGN